ncbi:MAG: hypothetical protein H6828_09475 [Planctomycetes bacterium]|nr:hypothetical protein [Planctomycetota bacterium]
MKYLTSTLLAAALLPSLALATDVNLVIKSSGATVVPAAVGQTLDYEVWVELSDAANAGLALCCFDLAFDGGALAQADAASGAAQLNFATPLGLCNPAGYGGTPHLGALLQVGGAQNTIKNVFASSPTGTVMPGLAQPGASLLFATGSVTMPANAGTFHLTPSNLIANVIRQGETGTGSFWAVDAAQPGVLGGLTIVVSDCAPVTYCTAKVSSQGCTPTITTSGTPSLSGADDFHLGASNVLNHQFGQLFYGPQGASTPFMGGTLCVSGGLTRTAIQASGGNAGGPDCSGAYDLFASQTFMASQGWTAGQTVYAQYWYRDPFHSDGTGFGLTNAVRFTVCP